MRRTSALRIVLLAMLAWLAAAGTASAGQLSNEAGTWVFRGAPGEVNNLQVGPSDARAGYFYFTDMTAPIALGDGCYREDWDDQYDARCPVSAAIRVELGDGDDRAIARNDLGLSTQVVFDGGPGADQLQGANQGTAITANGGDGNDTVEGGAGGNDVLDGGPGTDTVYGSGGNDVLRGGEGDDNLAGDGVIIGSDVIDGGPGRDTIDRDWIQNDRAGTLSVSLDGVANDGWTNEGDNVVNVEVFLISGKPANLTAGGDAVDFRIMNHDAGSSNVVGGPGNDVLRTYDYNDTIDGKAGDDNIEGGYGDDTIVGGPGRDTINAEAGTGSCTFLVCRNGNGNDTIQVRDGEVDSVACGVGTDTVVADANDTIAADCENVDRGAAPPPPDDRRRGGDKPRRSAKRCVVPKVKAGVTFAAAKKALAKKGCTAKAKKVRSAKVKKGRVVKVTVKAGKRLKHKAAVTVWVSRGKR